MIENFLIGAAGSFTASIVFIYFLFRYLRPRILISPNIAKRINERGIPAHTFKIINETPYPVVDIRIEIVLYTPRNIANGQVNDATILARHERFLLDSSKKLTEPFGNQTYYTYNNPEERWNDDRQHLVFRVMVRHSLTQFSRMFSHSYYRKGACIKLGQFSNGPSLDVVTEG